MMKTRIYKKSDGDIDSQVHLDVGVPLEVVNIARADLVVFDGGAEGILLEAAGLRSQEFSTFPSRRAFTTSSTLSLGPTMVTSARAWSAGWFVAPPSMPLACIARIIVCLNMTFW